MILSFLQNETNIHVVPNLPLTSKPFWRENSNFIDIPGDPPLRDKGVLQYIPLLLNDTETEERVNNNKLVERISDAG